MGFKYLYYISLILPTTTRTTEGFIHTDVPDNEDILERSKIIACSIKKIIDSEEFLKCQQGINIQEILFLITLPEFFFRGGLCGYYYASTSNVDGTTKGSQAKLKFVKNVCAIVYDAIQSSNPIININILLAIGSIVVGGDLIKLESRKNLKRLTLAPDSLVAIKLDNFSPVLLLGPNSDCSNCIVHITIKKNTARMDHSIQPNLYQNMPILNEKDVWSGSITRLHSNFTRESFELQQYEYAIALSSTEAARLRFQALPDIDVINSKPELKREKIQKKIDQRIFGIENSNYSPFFSDLRLKKQNGSFLTFALEICLDYLCNDAYSRFNRTSSGINTNTVDIEIIIASGASIDTSFRPTVIKTNGYICLVDGGGGELNRPKAQMAKITQYPEPRNWVLPQIINSASELIIKNELIKKYFKCDLLIVNFWKPVVLPE